MYHLYHCSLHYTPANSPGLLLTYFIHLEIFFFFLLSFLFPECLCKPTLFGFLTVDFTQQIICTGLGETGMDIVTTPRHFMG